MACARFPAARDLSRTLVLFAPPADWIRFCVAAIRRIALASSPEMATTGNAAAATTMPASTAHNAKVLNLPKTRILPAL